jgi:hypothetical protein
VSTYATILTTAGSPQFVGNRSAALGAIAIGVPLIADGGISAGMFVAALAVSSTIVDVSPFSTNGALMLANKRDSISEPLYHKQILTYAVIVTLAGPLLVWAALVLPGCGS